MREAGQALPLSVSQVLKITVKCGLIGRALWAFFTLQIPPGYIL